MTKYTTGTDTRFSIESTKISDAVTDVFNKRKHNGYDTDREDTVPLACSQCSEIVEYVSHDGDTGLVCGCRETPGTFKIERLDP